MDTVRNTWQIDDDYDRLPVDGSVVHARINLPIDVFPLLRIGPHQDDSDRRIPEISVPYFAPDLIVASLIGNVTRVHGAVYKDAVTTLNQFVLVPLVVSVVIANEHLVHRYLCVYLCGSKPGEDFKI